MIRPLYNWVLRQAETPYALWTLAAVSFIESSVFPIPPDVLMIPMIIAAPHRAWLIAGVCTLASVLGGAMGYYIGWGLFDSVGRPVLEFYHKADAFDALAGSYNDQGFWAVLIAGEPACRTPRSAVLLSGTTPHPARIRRRRAMAGCGRMPRLFPRHR